VGTGFALLLLLLAGCRATQCTDVAAFGNLGPDVNSPYDDYAPALADTATMVFTSDRVEEAGSGLQEINQPGRTSHLYFSMSLTSSWDRAQPYSLLLTRERVEAATIAFAPKNEPFNTVAYITACGREGSIGGCDVYAVTQGSSISVVNLGPDFNSGEWDGQPHVSADGKKIYFASSREGGQGGSDIWIADRLETGSWGTPYNAGTAVNGPDDEFSPFYDAPTGRLYFSAMTSDAGLDLFVLDPGATSRRRLQRPYNSESDDFTPFVLGGTLYLASKRVGGCGGFDLYGFAVE
jgi:hypothetical protein